MRAKAYILRPTIGPFKLFVFFALMLGFVYVLGARGLGTSVEVRMSDVDSAIVLPDGRVAVALGGAERIQWYGPDGAMGEARKISEFHGPYRLELNSAGELSIRTLKSSDQRIAIPVRRETVASRPAPATATIVRGVPFVYQTVNWGSAAGEHRVVFGLCGSAVASTPWFIGWLVLSSGVTAYAWRRACAEGKAAGG
jgi:hypothetical protein